MKARILVVDDDLDMCEMLRDGLTRSGFDVAICTSADEALAVLGTEHLDVLVTDLNMRGTSGIDLCRRTVESQPDLPVLVITAFGSLETAVAAIRAGAYDFITKPFELDALVLALERAVSHRRLHLEVKRLRSVVAETRRFEDVLGSSPAMREVYDLLGRVADSDTTVLISGESGTGKEVVAQALHRRSARKEGPFVAVNCTALPEPLLESELFGHARGAFTDAKAARAGLFVQANGGTLFLDEVGDMPLGLQPKLLRALQARAVRPVGGDKEIPFDARIVAATNRDLETAVEEKRFREDLYYRLNVIQVVLPPLRSRGSDVLLLAQHYLDRFARQAERRVVGISSAAAEKLLSYQWPGNVRELQNAMERAVALARYEEITVDDLPDRIRQYRRSHLVIPTEDPAEIVPLEEVERRYILRVFQAVGGNKSLAAKRLGLDRKTLYRKLERYGVETKTED